MNYYNILNTLSLNGFEAYIVGGYVRDKLLGRFTKEVDIITNASVKEIINIFTDNVFTVYEKYGAVKLKFNDDIVDITTFREDILYSNGKLENVKFVSKLEEDLIRRDFTINAICLDKFDNLVDPFNFIDDINLKLVRTIRDVKVVFSEDPSRIVRALRFMSILDFNLDKSIHDYILSNPKEIFKIPPTKLKKELDKLFESGCSSKFFDYIKNNNLKIYFGIDFDKVVIVKSSLGMWSQLSIDTRYKFSKKERKNISNIRYLINKGFIDSYDIYVYGLEVCLISSDILGIKRDIINSLYTNIKIKGIMDISITSEDICTILNIMPGKLVNNYLKMIEKEIVYGALCNNYKDIVNRLKEWGENNV